jgi:hypothetical protein
MSEDPYEIDIVIQGFPGKSVCHGGLGWSSVVLLRGHGRVALVDTGGFGMRRLLIERLASRGLAPKGRDRCPAHTLAPRSLRQLDAVPPRPHRDRRDRTRLVAR